MKKYAIASLVFLTMYGCTSKQDSEEKTSYSAQIREMKDNEYPDNPDISIRHALDGQFSHTEVHIQKTVNGSFDFVFLPGNFESDTLIIPAVNVMEYMPSAPEWIKGDKDLTYLAIVNQEWNRQQVKFLEGQFLLKGKSKESTLIKRVDLARNCLNAYLWEIIGYAEKEDGSLAPAYHGWFNFPKDLYAQLFEKRNDLKYSEYQASLEEWVDPVNRMVDFEELRDEIDEEVLAFQNLNDRLYPLTGERKKKSRNIIYPKNATSINDFLNDSTQFATFSIPGYYNTKDPRATQLSRIANLRSAKLLKVESLNSKGQLLSELELVFQNEGSDDQLIFTIGGIDFDKIDSLTIDTHQKGYQMPMGISNHSFYETYDQMLKNTSYENPFYALLTDEKGYFVDSHAVGIDGPLLWIDKNSGLLHLMILSFERHAFVGHYAFQL